MAPPGVAVRRVSPRPWGSSLGAHNIPHHPKEYPGRSRPPCTRQGHAGEPPRRRARADRSDGAPAARPIATSSSPRRTPSASSRRGWTSGRGRKPSIPVALAGRASQACNAPDASPQLSGVPARPGRTPQSPIAPLRGRSVASSRDVKLRATSRDRTGAAHRTWVIRARPAC